MSDVRKTLSGSGQRALGTGAFEVAERGGHAAAFPVRVTEVTAAGGAPCWCLCTRHAAGHGSDTIGPG